MSTSGSGGTRARPPAEASRTLPAGLRRGSPRPPNPHQPSRFPLWISSRRYLQQPAVARGRTHPCVHVNAHHESDAGLDTLDHHGVAEVSTAPGRSCRQRVPRVVELGRGDVDHAGVLRQQGEQHGGLPGGVHRAAPADLGAVGEHQPYVGGGAGGHRAEPGTQRRGQVGDHGDGGGQRVTGGSQLGQTVGRGADRCVREAGARRAARSRQARGQPRPVRARSRPAPARAATRAGPRRTRPGLARPPGTPTSADDTRASGVPRLTPAAARTWSGATVRVPSTCTSCTASSEDQPTTQAATASTATTTTSRSSRRRRRAADALIRRRAEARWRTR